VNAVDPGLSALERGVLLQAGMTTFQQCAKDESVWSVREDAVDSARAGLRQAMEQDQWRRALVQVNAAHAHIPGMAAMPVTFDGQRTARAALARLSPDELAAMRSCASEDPAVDSFAGLLGRMEDEARRADAAIAAVPPGSWAELGLAEGDLDALTRKTPVELERLVASGAIDRRSLLDVLRRAGYPPDHLEGLEIISDPRRLEKDAAREVLLLAAKLYTMAFGEMSRAGALLGPLGHGRGALSGEMAALASEMRVAAAGGALDPARAQELRRRYQAFEGASQRAFTDLMDAGDTVGEVLTAVKDGLKWVTVKGVDLLTAGQGGALAQGFLDATETFSEDVILEGKDAGASAAHAVADGLTSAAAYQVTRGLGDAVKALDNPAVRALAKAGGEVVIDAVHGTLDDVATQAVDGKEVDPLETLAAKLRTAPLDVAAKLVKGVVDAKLGGAMKGKGLPAKLVLGAGKQGAHGMVDVAKQVVDKIAASLARGGDLDLGGIVEDAVAKQLTLEALAKRAVTMVTKDHVAPALGDMAEDLEGAAPPANDEKVDERRAEALQHWAA
jgi:hypothetical protein